MAATADGAERSSGHGTGHGPAPDRTGRMVRIAGGDFLMGSDRFYPEEAPAHRARVAPFRIDVHPVTNAAFGRFVAETGYVTVAEHAPDPADYPQADTALLVPGSLVFAKPDRPVGLQDVRLWWRYVPGACWSRPEGAGSSVRDRTTHPVVHVAYEDASTYAAWAGKALPSEAEWEFAARGGLDGADYVWGDEAAPDGCPPANTWQGEFPWQNLGLDGYQGTSPVGAFPPNGYGLSDMAGNVWEWTADRFRERHRDGPARSCCMPAGTAAPDGREPSRNVLKGGSHLCAPNYCLRYRPAARQAQTIDTSASHIGFRCVVRP